jgi:hypothetical protein
LLDLGECHAVSGTNAVGYRVRVFMASPRRFGFMQVLGQQTADGERGGCDFVQSSQPVCNALRCWHCHAASLANRKTPPAFASLFTRL